MHRKISGRSIVDGQRINTKPRDIPFFQKQFSRPKWMPGKCIHFVMIRVSVTGAGGTNVPAGIHCDANIRLESRRAWLPMRRHIQA